MTMTLPQFIGSLVLACLLGILFGYLLFGKKNDHRKDKARITELEASLQDYKEQVQQHFSTTASLFQDLGQNYRNLYHYMAESADQLCPEGPETMALQFDSADLLPEQTSNATTQSAGQAEVASVHPETVVDTDESETPADGSAVEVEAEPIPEIHPAGTDKVSSPDNATDADLPDSDTLAAKTTEIQENESAPLSKKPGGETAS